MPQRLMRMVMLCLHVNNDGMKKIIQLKEEMDILYPITEDGAVMRRGKPLSKVPFGGINHLLSDVNHIVGAGQSLGAGSGSLVTISSNQFGDNDIVFNTGLVFNKDSAPTSFITNPYSTTENPSTAAASTFLRLSGMAGAGKKLLSSNCSVGSTTIEQWLKSADDLYNGIINAVRHAYNIALASGQTYRLLGILWTQGEHNKGSGKDDYKAKLISIREDIIADVEEMTGDDYSDLPVIMYECMTAGDSIYQAHYELVSNPTSYFFCGAPIYYLKYNDQWHLDSLSYKKLGSSYGSALFYVMAGINYKPLTPRSYMLNSAERYLDVTFNTIGRLVLDVPEIASDSFYGQMNGALPAKGFFVYTSNNTNLNKITAVEIISDDTVRYHLNSVVAGMKFRAGVEEGGSFRFKATYLRDNVGDRVNFIYDGIHYRCDNWCPYFEFNI